MAQFIDRNQLDRIRRRFFRLYGEQAHRCMQRLEMMVGAYGVGLEPVPVQERWNEKDVVLITYADSIRDEQQYPLQVLHEFCNKRLKGAIKTVHLLPFYPWSSDDGFSVIDYREVDTAVGRWRDVESLGGDFNLMFDLVLNHVSSRSTWFKEYVQCILPFNTYFKEASPKDNLKAVVRPRTSPLLTKVTTRDGKKHVWTTFSADQVDLNWENPDVFFEFLDIFMGYIARGARIIRLDAVAFIWKTIGTTCIHLKETHEVVKLFRDILEMLAPGVILLTETNVPHKENISYFGNGDEAHMVYNFSLPPLLLHGLLTENSKHLRKWAAGLGHLPAGCTYFNFTSSHDGIGVRPLQGILPNKELDFLVDCVEERKGKVSYKSNSDGSKSPYELNITYFEALSVPGNLEDPVGLVRFLTSQYVALSLQGMPAVYIHCLTACANDQQGVEASGIPRRINRHKWSHEHLVELIKDDGSFHSTIFNQYVLVLRRRAMYPAFHPDAPQEVLSVGTRFFGVRRVSRNGSQSILCISNFTSKEQKLSKVGDLPGMEGLKQVKDIISGDSIKVNRNTIKFAPYQTLWLVL